MLVKQRTTALVWLGLATTTLVSVTTALAPPNNNPSSRGGVKKATTVAPAVLPAAIQSNLAESRPTRDTGEELSEQGKDIPQSVCSSESPATARVAPPSESAAVETDTKERKLLTKKSCETKPFFQKK